MTVTFDGAFEEAAEIAPGSRKANDNLRGWLRRQGDYGSSPRTVLHYAYPAGDEAGGVKSLIARELRARGFHVSDAALRNGLVFEHEAIVASERFDAETAAIADLLAAFGWDYDAWECEPQMDTALVYWRTLRAMPLH